MLISVIIPVYNEEQYLAQCLDSILQQDFNEYEIICVNDASTDKSKEILNSYVAISDRIRVVTHSQNKGLSCARNTGLLNAKGKYVIFVDADDMIMQGALRDLYGVVEKNCLDILYYNMLKINEDVVPYHNVTNKIYEYEGIFTGRELFCRFSENKDYKIEVWRQVLKREFLIINNLFFYEGILHEDNLFSFLCAMKANRVMNINREYYIYRQHNGSIMHTKNGKRARSIYILLAQIFTYWNINIFSERENKAIADYFQRLYDQYEYDQCFNDRKEIEFGSEAEKSLYAMLYREKRNKWFELTDEQVNSLNRFSHVIVYGAGRAAKEVIEALRNRGIEIEKVVVENVKENPQYFCNIKVTDYREWENRLDTCVVIGVSRKYAGGIEENLKKIGLTNIIRP